MVSVTKLIDILNKPSLMYWANNIGLKGLTLKEYRNNLADQGNKKHNKVELYLKNGTKFEGYEKLDLALKGYEVISVEKTVSNDFLIGRIDLVLKKDNKIYVVDFKKNKKIYLATKLQLSTYKHLAKADEICYINFEDFKIIPININTEYYYTIVKRLYQINELLKQLNERL